MDTACTPGQTEGVTTGSTSMTKSTAKVFTLGRMGANTLDSGKMVNSTDKVSIGMQMATVEQEYGLMASGRCGLIENPDLQF